MDKLIIAEKPSVALRIATALSDAYPKRNAINGVGYYEIPKGADTFYVVAAAGHLFTMKQKSSGGAFPVFDVEWVPSYKVNKYAYFTKKYLDAIEVVGKKCTLFINACDYDVEGTVIGTNIIKFVLTGDVNLEIKDGNVKRMKFSTTTKSDLLNAFENLGELDYNNFNAGETRHTLDWIWGINLSRALMYALMTNGIKKIISIGRVQGPTLAILAERESEIKNFISKPYWQILLRAKGVQFTNRRGNVLDKKVADEALERSKSGKIFVEEIQTTEVRIRPYPPFDLTSLQLEASKVFRIDPSRTLAIAQTLYERSYISYPRTSSQKLPYTLNLPRIIGELAKNEKYKGIAEYLISASMYKPNEGAKEDEAHPAIFPTGVMPKELSQEEEKIYDLVVKRFIACFGSYAVSEITKVIIDANGEKYAVQGKVYKERGWMKLYEPYLVSDETEMPLFTKGEVVKADKIYSKELQTRPPARYTKASLIALLERKELGTKATRAEIIETLFKRGYVKNQIIEVTDYGLSVYRALHDYCAEILDQNLTRQLELDMDKIVHGLVKKDQVIDEGKDIVKKIIAKFKENEVRIGAALATGLKESEKANILGKCTKDGGDLIIKRSKLNKNFVSCSNWPNCDATYPLPQNAKIVPTKKVCEFCHTPIVKVFRRGKVFEMDLDPNCVTKKNWAKAPAAEEVRVTTAAAIKEEQIEKVRKPKRVAKKSRAKKQRIKSKVSK